MKLLFWIASGALLLTAAIAAAVDGSPVPKYKPSSRSPEAIDIRSAAYGASRLAPDALNIGDVAPNFTVARAGGSELSFPDATRNGPTVIIFYRGHW